MDKYTIAKIRLPTLLLALLLLTTPCSAFDNNNMIRLANDADTYIFGVV